MEEEEVIAGVLNEYCEKKLFSEDIGMTMTEDDEDNEEERIIKNAWRKTGYKWFSKEVDEITPAAVMNEGA